MLPVERLIRRLTCRPVCNATRLRLTQSLLQVPQGPTARFGRVFSKKASLVANHALDGFILVAAFGAQIIELLQLLVNGFAQKIGPIAENAEKSADVWKNYTTDVKLHISTSHIHLQCTNKQYRLMTGKLVKRWSSGSMIKCWYCYHMLVLLPHVGIVTTCWHWMTIFLRRGVLTWWAPWNQSCTRTVPCRSLRQPRNRDTQTKCWIDKARPWSEWL